MTQQEIFQLKLNCLQLAAGQLQAAQDLYTWVTQEAKAEEAAKNAQKEALSLVK